jgi:NAD(P)H-quinone oxidoreductase subunit 4
MCIQTALWLFSFLLVFYISNLSGFVSELTVFLGLTTSDAYSPTFKTVVILLTAVGLMLTPIYLTLYLATSFL